SPSAHACHCSWASRWPAYQAYSALGRGRLANRAPDPGSSRPWILDITHLLDSRSRSILQRSSLAQSRMRSEPTRHYQDFTPAFLTTCYQRDDESGFGRTVGLSTTMTVATFVSFDVR